ncbi:helix-turn-helix transcriptional regulator [Pseudomonadales bacterium]|nr:helix-turn-helix transcriptional regulator [Pseudomonadales bacterium]
MSESTEQFSLEDDQTMTLFSTRLKQLRSDSGLSLRGLAKEVGVTANAVLRWEKAEVTPTRGKMIELARFFQVEPGWLGWGLGNKDSSIGLEALIAKISRLTDAEMSAISAIVDSLEEARNQAVELVADSVGDPVAASPMNNGVD